MILQTLNNSLRKLHNIQYTHQKLFIKVTKPISLCGIAQVNLL